MHELILTERKTTEGKIEQSQPCLDKYGYNSLLLDI